MLNIIECDGKPEAMETGIENLILTLFICHRLCKLENEILKKAINAQK